VYTTIEAVPINGRKIVIYGAGHDADVVLRVLSKLEIFPAFSVVSTGQDRTGQDRTGQDKKPLLADILDKAVHFVIIASSKYHREMERTLYAKDYESNRDFFVWDIFNTSEEAKLIAFFASQSPLESTMLDSVYYASCDSARTILALTTTTDRNFRVRFCFPDKHNFNLKIPEVIFGGEIGEFVADLLEYREKLLEGLKICEYLCLDCENCTRKRKTVWLDDMKFKAINVGGHPAPCNFKCSYCDARSDENTVAFSAHMLKLYRQTLDTLKRRNMIDSDAFFALANGEITVNPSQAEYLSLADGYMTKILTNASVWSQLLADKISDGKSMLQVSIDAGSKDTFRSSKGVNAWERVCLNLRKYSNYGKVVLKYILLPGINDGENDFKGIVRLLNEIHSNSLWISTDMYLLDKNTTSLISEPLVKFIHYLLENGIRAYGYESFLTDDVLYDISEKLKIQKE
jgi:wyosine [tRNA(Phe)-imidazoG37] synthetase (radical SAM superfamily)